MGSAVSQDRKSQQIHAVFIQNSKDVILSIDAVYHHHYLAKKHADTLNLTYKITKIQMVAGVCTCNDVEHIEDLLEQVQVDKTINIPLIDGKIIVSNKILV